MKPLIIFTANQSMALYKFRLGVMLFLKNQGYQIIAIAPSDSFSQKIVQLGIQFIPVKLNSYKKNPIADIKLFINLLILYKQLKPIFIFHYTVKLNIYGTLAAYIAGNIPSISVVPGRGYSFQKKNWLYRLVNIFYRFSLGYTREVWFLNEEDRDFFVTEGMVERRKTIILPSEGVNTEYYAPRRVMRSKIQDGLTFMLSGRLLWEKGVDEFVKSARLILERYPKTKFHLLGFLDPLDKRVVPAEKIQEWEVEGIVKFMGVAEDVRPFFINVDCFVLPSYYGEGLPRTLLEAASMEIPIITTSTQGCKDAVSVGENGLLCEPRSVNDLVEKLVTFIELSTADKIRMGKAGRKKVKQQFDEKFVIRQYLSKINLYCKTNIDTKVI